MEDSFLYKTTGTQVVCILGVKMWNVDFVEISITGLTDFIVWHSAARSDLPSNSKFSFEGNVGNVNHTWASMCNAFALVF
jgi:hypothetical protein